MDDEVTILKIRKLEDILNSQDGTKLDKGTLNRIVSMARDIVAAAESIKLTDDNEVIVEDGLAHTTVTQGLRGSDRVSIAGGSFAKSVESNFNSSLLNTRLRRSTPTTISSKSLRTGSDLEVGSSLVLKSYDDEGTALDGLCQDARGGIYDFILFSTKSAGLDHGNKNDPKDSCLIFCHGLIDDDGQNKSHHVGASWDVVSLLCLCFFEDNHLPAAAQGDSPFILVESGHDGSGGVVAPKKPSSACSRTKCYRFKVLIILIMWDIVSVTHIFLASTGLHFIDKFA